MTDKGSNGRANWWHDLKNRASQAVSDKEAAFARGKIAGVAVTDDAGNMLVEAGHRIDEGTITRARNTGKLAALAAAAMKAHTQDLKEKVGAQYSRTDSGREALLLDSVEEYREARNYLRRILTMDVTDIRGNILVPSGKALDDEDIRRARDAGLLSALLVAAQQSLPAPPEERTAAPEPSWASPKPRPAPLLSGAPEDNSVGEPEGQPVAALPMSTPPLRAPRSAPLLLATPDEETDEPPHRTEGASHR